MEKSMNKDEKLQTYLYGTDNSGIDTFADYLQNLTLEQLQQKISFLVNAAMATATIHKLTVKEPKGNFNMRPSLHVLIGMPTGQLKSTILNEIATITKRQVITETSKAGLVGSIDQRAQDFVEGAAWEARNSLLLLDEFTFGRKNKEGWEVFLQLLENQHWSRRIGISSKKIIKKDGDLYLKVDKGKIDLKIRFSAIIATMKRFELQRGDSFRAFATRTVPFRTKASFEVLQQVSKGEKIFLYQPFTVKPEVVIPLETYNIISDYADQKIKDQAAKLFPTWICKEIYLRSIGDICRVYAVHQKIDFEMWNNIINWKLSAQLAIGKYYKDAEEQKRKQQSSEA